MADDVVLNSMAGGETVATDQIASKHYQRIKLIHGADGVNDGDVSRVNPLPVILRNTAGESLEDALDGDAIVIIDHEHHEIHAGRGFKLSGKIASLGNGNSYNILLKNPAGTDPHLRKYRITTSSAPCDIHLFEGTTVSADGTALNIYNCRRSSATVATVTAFHTPTITGDGTQIDYELLTGNKQQGGSGDDVVEEWNFNPNTNYLLRITNNSGSAAVLGYDIFFYED